MASSVAIGAAGEEIVHRAACGARLMCWRGNATADAQGVDRYIRNLGVRRPALGLQVKTTEAAAEEVCAFTVKDGETFRSRYLDRGIVIVFVFALGFGIVLPGVDLGPLDWCGAQTIKYTAGAAAFRDVLGDLYCASRAELGQRLRGLLDLLEKGDPTLEPLKREPRTRGEKRKRELQE